MPLINGVCVPFACLTRRLIRPGAKLFQIIFRGGVPAPQVTDVTNNPLYAGLLPQGLNQLAAVANIDCDGCICAAKVRFNPPPRVPASLVVDTSEDTDAAGVKTIYVYVVTAQWDILTLGTCFPPGTLIKVGNNFVPVEEAPKTPTDWPPKGGTGGGGKKKKKKKKKTVKRRVAKAPAKKVGRRAKSRTKTRTARR